MDLKSGDLWARDFFALFYIVFSSFLVASRQVSPGQLSPGQLPGRWELVLFGTCTTGRNCLLWNLSTWELAQGEFPNPALKTPPNDKYSPNIGSLYPI